MFLCKNYQFTYLRFSELLKNTNVIIRDEGIARKNTIVNFNKRND
jgi:hypothetical protein